MASANKRYGFTIAGIDAFGNQKISSEKIIGVLGVTEGIHFEQGTLKIRKMREDIEALGYFSHVHIVLVLYVDEKAYITVNVIEKGGIQQLIFRPSPTETVHMPDEILTLYNEYLARWGQSIHHHTTIPMLSDQESNFGHRFSADVHSRSLEERFIDLAQRHQNVLLDVLEHDQIPPKRRVTAAMLGWTPDPAPTVITLSNELSEPDVIVRNNASLSLIHASRYSVQSRCLSGALAPRFADAAPTLRKGSPKSCAGARSTCRIE